jgi:microcystin-dependent protein
MTSNGQAPNVQQYQELFSLISNMYGGNIAQGTFGPPNFQGRPAIGIGKSPTSSAQHAIANVYGTETTTLTAANLPSHAQSGAIIPSTIRVSYQI